VVCTWGGDGGRRLRRSSSDLGHGVESLVRADDQGDRSRLDVRDQIATTHIKNPHAPPGPTNDIVHWIVDKGQPGLDEPGDSIAIEGMKHMSVSIKVTAPAGTTLYFICAVHPWMQGEIKVT
jgi:hypothetical protein